MFRNLELEDMVVNGEVEQWVRLNEVEELSEFEDWYWVSSFGRVKSVGGRKDKIMKQSIVGAGYLRIDLQTSNRKRKVMLAHRLVAFAFVSGYEDGLVVNHLDEDKENNHYSNLEWCTQKKNVNHGTRTERHAEKMTNGITSKAVIGTCVKTGKVIEFPSTAEAQRNGFYSSGISNACRGKYASHCKHGGTDVYKGFKWSYKESA